MSPRRDDEEEGGMMAWSILSVFFGILGFFLGIVIGVLGAAIYFSDRMTRAEQAAAGAQEAPVKTEEFAPPPPEQLPETPAPASPDELTMVAGIGPAYARRLQENGITTFAQLASMTPEEIGAAIDADPRRIRNADWVGQAATLAAGK